MTARNRSPEITFWWRFGAALVGPVMRLLFRLRFRGLEHIPANGPAIVAANHVSIFDGVVLGLASVERGRIVRFLAAAEWFERPSIAWALRLYRQIPVRRGEGDSGALDVAVATLRAGALAGIFPEGRVARGPGLERGRTGVARIALAVGAPVVPSASGEPRPAGPGAASPSAGRSARGSRCRSVTRSNPEATSSRPTRSRPSPTS